MHGKLPTPRMNFTRSAIHQRTGVAFVVQPNHSDVHSAAPENTFICPLIWVKMVCGLRAAQNWRRMQPSRRDAL
jgi:hypothetical protein